jgi:hypothetical protein
VKTIFICLLYVAALFQPAFGASTAAPSGENCAMRACHCSMMGRKGAVCLCLLHGHAETKGPAFAPCEEKRPTASPVTPLQDHFPAASPALDLPLRAAAWESAPARTLPPLWDVPFKVPLTTS